MRQLMNLKGASLPDQASDMLKEFIIAKQVHLGNYLPPEHELCKTLGIGRSTLREAITILESKGLVKRFHGQGVKVVNESKRATADLFQLFMMREGSTIHDLIEVRTIIEVQTVVLATERATQTDLNSIQTALSIMKSTDVLLEEYIQADIDFHLQIAKATHNNVLLVLLETIRPLLHNAIVATLQSNPRPEQSLHYHEKIYSAIENRDKEGASKAMADHLKGTEAMINKLDTHLVN